MANLILKVPEVSIKAQQMPYSGEVFMLYYVSSFQGKVRPRGKFFSVEHRTKDNTRNPFPLQLCGWATNTLQYIMLGPLVTADRQQPSWLLQLIKNNWKPHIEHPNDSQTDILNVAFSKSWKEMKLLRQKRKTPLPNVRLGQNTLFLHLLIWTDNS